ncbi:hypothetical protein PanWU01x14_032370 [Parasponia andersonii]|uniref:Uncharacterized protein n=1 Tax=Parasponia andersonii TaxID=3476 RepID=A0A2P5DUI1_PARAD|nr:hypothetical protein PanWU01x14_032370 [Parasponia andersonii]
METLQPSKLKMNDSVLYLQAKISSFPIVQSTYMCNTVSAFKRKRKRIVETKTSLQSPSFAKSSCTMTINYFTPQFSREIRNWLCPKEGNFFFPPTETYNL